MEPQPKVFLIEYFVECKSCFVDSEKYETTVKGKRFRLELTNFNVEPGTPHPTLLAHLYIEAANFEEAETNGDNFINLYLDIFGFTCGAPFRVEKVNFIADWTPGLLEREMIFFSYFPGHQLPVEIIDQSIVMTAQELAEANFEGAFGRAIRWFNNGLNARVKEDQFQYFWFAIEQLSSFYKKNEKVNDACPKCRGPLFCEACGEHPLHKPYPKQAIKQLFESLFREGSDRAFTHADKFRNALMHGEEVEPLERQFNVKFEKIVELVGNVSWSTIVNLFPTRIEEKKQLKLNLLKPESFLHQSLTTRLSLGFSTANPDAPQLHEIPRPSVEMVFNRESDGELTE
ncbi:methylamine utilization protein MauJ [Rheinheimera sp. F8]|uniref:methylamine utilization protein MauJ n=1 Tax=Rheinheimera sp. F8 TaxID=1763998 RepID=UPI0007448BA6|nr:methylamine utilization protein MauJ [Rheinheimera sp. F8]ALZ76682.1 hypothetical protein ATY27_13560 [Rheinheimera sp. F8]